MKRYEAYAALGAGCLTALLGLVTQAALFIGGVYLSVLILQNLELL